MKVVLVSFEYEQNGYVTCLVLGVCLLESGRGRPGIEQPMRKGGVG